MSRSEGKGVLSQFYPNHTPLPRKFIEKRLWRSACLRFLGVNCMNYGHVMSLFSRTPSHIVSIRVSAQSGKYKGILFWQEKSGKPGKTRSKTSKSGKNQGTFHFAILT